MVSALKHFRDILCKFRFTRGFVHHFFRRWALFVAFLGRRLDAWRPWSNRGRGTFQKAEKAECSSPGTATRLESRECGVALRVAASYIPASASHPSLHNTSTVSSAAPPAANLTVEPPSHRDHGNPSSAFEAEIRSNRRSTDSSVRSCSRASDYIVQAHSCESVQTPIIQPAQVLRDPRSQSGRGPSVSLSRERSSRSRSPPDRFLWPRLEIDVTNTFPQAHVDGGNSSVNASSVASNAPAPLSSSSINGRCRRESSTSASVVVGVQNPSINSHPLSPSIRQPPLAEGPYIIGSPHGHSSPVSGVLDPLEGSTQYTHTTSFSSATSNFDLPDDRFFELINPEQISRYTKEATVPRERTHYEIPPLTRTFLYFPAQTSLEQDCAPWVPATHPGGALYFFDRDRRLFTDTDMHHPMLRKEMEDFYQCLQRVLDRDGVVIPSKNYDLFLNITRSRDGRIRWSYYYACHETRCLFWLGPYDATAMISKLFGVTSPAHIKHRLEALYWTHWSLFPAVFEGRRLGRAVVDELVGMLSHGCMDVMTRPTSTLPYDVDTMQKMLALVQNAKEPDAGLVYHTAAVTQLLASFAHWRFIYFHGQRGSRLERHKTVYTGTKQERTLLITSLSPVLFFAPEGYLLLLKVIWVDGTVAEGVWKRFISRLLREWEQLILSSTVMLSVNVGFLAIPGVVVSSLNTNITGANQVVIFTSPAQIASCMSIVASAGSIVIGMLLLRRSDRTQDADSEVASAVLSESAHPIFGLEPMAIILSLPWALVMWSMVTFFVALLLFCFGTSNALTRISVAVTTVVMVVFIGWCTRSTWGSFGAMKRWSSGLLPLITPALDIARATCRQILVIIDCRPHRESLTV